jgi:hypothetical protein
MLESKLDFRPPSREEIASVLRQLISGEKSRGEASEWASRWVCADDTRVTDKAVWEALTSLLGADLISTDRPYFYAVEDFAAWLKELKDAV